ncbi:Bug family tripartite tricarboxylate transporter substrate binding protein [Roseomonas sp. GCM10028921]
MIARRRLIASSTALFSATTIRRARAQIAWPRNQPIEIIVPYPPGGGVDMVARLVAQHLPAKLPGARLVVVNRAGAGGQVGFEAIFNAAPNGYTLGAVTVPAINTFALERPVRYRPLDFSFLCNVVDDPNTIYVKTESPIRGIADLVAAAKARPGALSYGTTGNGSDDHVLMLSFEEIAELKPMTHVPFAGAAPLLTQVLGGHLELGVGNMAEVLAPLRDGVLRCLGNAAPARWNRAPEVPTFREQGLDLISGSARGIVGPPGLPEPVRETLTKAMAEVTTSPAFLADADKAGLPLRILAGPAYHTMAWEADRSLGALWKRRPWG